MDEQRFGVRHLLGRHAVAIDAALAAVLAVLGVVSLWTPPDFIQVDFREPDALGVALVLLAAAAVAFRSRFPVSAHLIAAVASLVPLHLGYHQTIGGLPVLLTLYSVAVARPARVSAACAAAVWAAIALLLVSLPVDVTPGEWIANSVVLLTGWGVGRSVRARREYTRGLEERNRALVAARETSTRVALVEERTRIAREMQDLVAHHLSEMTVQAGAARRFVRVAPEVAEEALATVESTGRSALEEMRRILGVLSPDGSTAQRRPQPGLHELDDLLDQERAAGLDVTCSRQGTPRALEPGASLTAYRVVQEALVNARTHAGRAAVRVCVDWEPGCVRVSVEDDGRGSTSRWSRRGDRDGLGLAQLRERTTLYGGSFRAGPRRGGGFTVRATLPTTRVGRVA